MLFHDRRGCEEHEWRQCEDTAKTDLDNRPTLATRGCLRCTPTGVPARNTSASRLSWRSRAVEVSAAVEIATQPTADAVTKIVPRRAEFDVTLVRGRRPGNCAPWSC